MLDLYMLCADLKNAHSDMRKKSNDSIRQIYEILNRPTEKTAFILKAWKENFQYMYGEIETNLSSNSKLNIEEILFRYEIPAQEENYMEATLLLFYSIQTYFSILVKGMMNFILGEKQSSDASFQELILGNFADKHGIINYCSPDWYCWPVFELENGFQEIIDDIIVSIASYQSIISLEDFARNNNYD